MRVSKNWVKFNKMFTLSPWFGLPSGGQVSTATLILAIRLCDEPTRPASADDASFLHYGAKAGVRRLIMGKGEGNGARHIPAIS